MTIRIFLCRMLRVPGNDIDIGVSYSRNLDTAREASESFAERARPGTPVWTRSHEA